MSFLQVLPPTKKPSSVLYTYIKKNRYTTKIIVIFSDAKKAEYFNELMRYFFINSVTIHEMQDHETLKKSREHIRTQGAGIVFTTNTIMNNNVAEDRLFKKDYTIMQYDPPTNLELFLRLFNKCQGGKNSLILFLRKEEKEFFQKLKETNIMIKRVSFNKSLLEDIPSHVSKLVYDGMPSPKTYKTTTRPYGMYQKEIFNIDSLSFVDESRDLSTKPVVSVPMQDAPQKMIQLNMIMTFQKEQEKMEEESLANERKRCHSTDDVLKAKPSCESVLDSKRTRLEAL
ncbi:ATP-dependent RNA helicase has-1-like [Trichogramma pretiosum]|uniref:ATP-dependent RNA helicase has-1-like n=1 Tax=Trichogramma pretiosum TaxID=7493 RepID=UPI0006C9E56F|nr:ATP-dependent RNA helicase has-1-like [Trichogramma pretiosum]